MTIITTKAPDMFSRRFAAANGGAKDLYDVRRHVQQRGAHAEPGSVAWFLWTLRDGKYASGSYPKFWLVSDGETLSYAACLANCGTIARAIRDGSRDGWRVVACDVNWEDPAMFCADTGERIESAYSEDTVRPIPSGTAVKLDAHHSAPGKGLSYEAGTAELVDPCETDGWDVIDVRLPDGTERSVYSFSVIERV
jgi:hypothetical protein